jgi:hypothetical protein
MKTITLLAVAFSLAACGNPPTPSAIDPMDAVILGGIMGRQAFPPPAPIQPTPQPAFTQPTFVTTGNRTVMCQQIAPGQITCF